MKTAKEVSDHIKSNAVTMKDIEGTPLFKRLKKENQLLRQCELYLKTSPREEYLKSELSFIKIMIDSINSHYSAWIQFNSGKFKNPQTAYKIQMGIPILQAKIKTLKYLLDV